jgi:hypothetical protein
MLKANPNADVPTDFLEAFRKLARRTRTPRMFEPETARDYFDALNDHPLSELAAAAETLARTSVFFPTVAEWRAEVMQQRLSRHEVASTQASQTTECGKCADRGLIAVRYECGEPFDIAICDCAIGKRFRHAGELVVQHRLGLGPENRVAYLEDFEDEPEAEGAA